MQFIKVALVLCAVSFATHYAWELSHISLYRSYQSLGSGTALTLHATLGDVAYTFAAVALVAVFKRRVNWIPGAKLLDYIGLGILGFCVALLVEYKALALHLWAYTALMPLLLGVGISPLLQMTILLPLSVFVTHLFVWRSRSKY